VHNHGEPVRQRHDCRLQSAVIEQLARRQQRPLLMASIWLCIMETDVEREWKQLRPENALSTQNGFGVPIRNITRRSLKRSPMLAPE